MSIRACNVRCLAIALFLLGALALKSWLVEAPQPPAEIAAGEFDHRRALERLERILGDQRPHPVDSPESDPVRDRLIGEIEALGLEPQLREATDCSGFPGSRAVSCSHVRNIVAVLPGPDRPALLLNAHYDSTPTGPGAADDGIGVASLLEIGSLLKDSPRSRPVILLFNEGEEYGLNGAAVFAERDPMADRVGSLINLEARGVTGPALMFETSLPNGRAIEDFKASAKAPYANSASADVAKFIPNTTDVVKFRPRGWEILNFGIIGNETRYHSPGDDIAHLDPASLKHMGDEALAAARRLAGPDRAMSDVDYVYTDIAGLALIKAPDFLAFVILGGLLLGGAAMVHRYRGWPTLARPAAALLASTLVAAVIAYGASVLRPGDYWRAYPQAPTLAVAATVVALQSVLMSWAANHADRSKLQIAAWTLILSIGTLLTLVMPGAAIFFLIAPALGLMGTWWRPLAWLGALVQLVMLAEIAELLQMTMIDGPTWAMAPLIAIIALPFLAEAGRSGRIAHLLLWAIAAALWIVCLAVPRSTEERPLAMTIDHVQDDRDGTARWAIASKQAPLPDGFASFGSWEKGSLPYYSRTRWMADAPILDGPQATVLPIGQRSSESGRKVRLRLDRRAADAILLRFDKDVPVLAMGLPGNLRKLDPEQGPAVLRCTGRHCDGMVVEITLGTPDPVEALLLSQRYAAPAEAEPLVAERPSDAHPQYSPDSQVRVRAIRF